MVRQFDHIFDGQGAEVQRKFLELPQHSQSKATTSSAICGVVLKRVLDNLPRIIGWFANLNHMTPAPAIVFRDTADQLGHTDPSSDPCLLPPSDGQVSQWQLSTFWWCPQSTASRCTPAPLTVKFAGCALISFLCPMVICLSLRPHTSSMASPPPPWVSTPRGDVYAVDTRQASPPHIQECNSS